MRNSFKIKIDLEDVQDFLNASNSITNDVTIYQTYYVASGKSLMGIYTMDLSKPINLVVRDIENNDIIYEKFSRWLVGV